MWDLIVSVPDHCLSFYFAKSAVRVVKLYRRNILVYCQQKCFLNVYSTPTDVLHMLPKLFKEDKYKPYMAMD